MPTRFIPGIGEVPLRPVISEQQTPTEETPKLPNLLPKEVQGRRITSMLLCPSFVSDKVAYTNINNTFDILVLHSSSLKFRFTPQRAQHLVAQIDHKLEVESLNDRVNKSADKWIGYSDAGKKAEVQEKAKPKGIWDGRGVRKMGWKFHSRWVYGRLFSFDC